MRVKGEVHPANVSFEHLKDAYLSLEPIHLSCSSDTMRKSSQATPDSSSIDSPGSLPRNVKGFFHGSPVEPNSKARETPADDDLRADRSDAACAYHAPVRRRGCRPLQYFLLAYSSSSSPPPSPSLSASTYL